MKKILPLVLLSAVALAGCGRKGELTLPSQATAATAAAISAHRKCDDGSAA